MRKIDGGRRWLWLAAAIIGVAMPCAQAQSTCEPEALPATMRAVQLHEYGGPDKLRLEEIARPDAGPGEVLIRIRAASINPVDWKLREGALQKWWPLQFPAILGRDVSGEIAAVGEGVQGWRCGEAVVGYLERAPNAGKAPPGGYAEFVAVDARDVVRKPVSMSFEQAAAFPLVAVTAWSALIDTAQLKAGERVLIHGGAGGVGSMAVQIAKARGAHVIATASARNHDYVRSIGADEIIDYRAVRFEDVAKDIDVVLDTVGGDTLQRSPTVLRDGGRLVSITARPPAACDEGRITCPPDAGTPDKDSAALVQIAQLIDAGKLGVNVDRVFPLEQVGAAQELNREGHTRGKIVVRMRE